MIHQYLKERGELSDIPATGLPFITISRESGAGGHLLAHVLTADFQKYNEFDFFKGWHVFDREICQVVAEDPELETSFTDLISESYRSEFRDLMSNLFMGRSEQYVKFKKVFKVVRILATLGKVILVGQAAACVTADMPSGIHLRLVAPEATRTRWMMKKFNMSKEDAMAMMAQQDENRRKVAKNFFSRNIDDPLLYHATFNGDKMTPHEMSYAVIEMLKLRMKQTA
jgi:cytidylate kinase